MMEKTIVLEVKKEAQCSVYIFAKIREFIDFFDEFLDEFNLYDYETERNNIYLDIQEKKDGYYKFKNDNYDIDVFIGGTEIVLVIRTKDDKQQEISDKIFKFVKFKG